MTDNIPVLCKNVLRKIFETDLEKYVITVGEGGSKGDGYMNEMIFLDLCSEAGHKHLVIKMMPEISKEDITKVVSNLFKTELLFYETVWPTLDNFQRKYAANQLFDKIPRYYGSASEKGRTALVLENEKLNNFLLREKHRVYDKELAEFLFKHFGHFHAISLAFKDKHKDEFDRLTSLLTETWNTFKNWKVFERIVADTCKLAAAQFTADEGMKNKITIFAERVGDEYNDVTLYKGNHHVIIHGDSWINNFLFKHNESREILDVRAIDFQAAQPGTPVYDLSYNFYSGATKDLLVDLEHYLKVYHDSLSSKLREFGCDPDEIYPYESLREEWRTYSRFGFMQSLLIWRIKTSETVMHVTDADPSQSLMDQLTCDEAKFAEVTGDLIRHMYEHDFL